MSISKPTTSWTAILCSQLEAQNTIGVAKLLPLANQTNNVQYNSFQCEYCFQNE